MIGGNVTAIILKKTPGAKDSRGVATSTWARVATLTGWLDLMGGDSRYTLESAKARESTHIFLADWKRLNVTENDARISVGGNLYDVMLLDDPMGMHRQLEIYLKYIGPEA